MGLQQDLGVDLTSRVQEHVVHRDVAGAQVLGPSEHRHVRERAPGVLDDDLAVGVDHNLVDRADLQQGPHHVVVERQAAERTVVLARNPLAVVAHRHDGDDAAHRAQSTAVGLIVSTPLLLDVRVATDPPGLPVRD